MHSASDASAAAARTTIGSGADLTAEVTVFVTTVGASTYEACISRLEAQDVTVGFGLIDHVAPLPNALQQMIDRCSTRYFVQVDEDMLLDEDAVRRLYELMEAEWPNVAVLVGQLYDSHLRRPIEGVKLHRLDYVSQFPWPAFASVLERNSAIEAAGYRIARRPLVESGAKMTFGLHDIGRDPWTIFQRYRDLERLRRAWPEELAWFADYPAEFERRLREGPDEADFFALQGVLAVSTESSGAVEAAVALAPKDYRQPAMDAAFETAVRLWASRYSSDRSAG